MSLLLALGTNLGDKILNLQECVNSLNLIFGDYLEISKVFRSEPFGSISQDEFLNLVIVYDTPSALSPIEILGLVKNLELNLGRTNSVHWGPRLIDIDILFIDDIKVNSLELTIPHPQINNRSFVVQPLSQLRAYSYLSRFYNFESVFQTKSVELRSLF